MSDRKLNQSLLQTFAYIKNFQRVSVRKFSKKYIIQGAWVHTPLPHKNLVFFQKKSFMFERIRLVNKYDKLFEIIQLDTKSEKSCNCSI